MRIQNFLLFGLLVLSAVTPGQLIGAPPASRYQTSKVARSVQPNDTWRRVEQAIDQHFAKRPGYNTGDLLSRGDVAPLWKAFEKSGWKTKRQREIDARMLSEKDFLIVTLRGKSGTAFMRNVAKTTGGFAQLDRFRRLPDGEKRVRELIRQPGGHTLIQYLAGTRGGRSMGREIARRSSRSTPVVKDPIYTEAELRTALKSLFEQENSAHAR